MLDPLVQRLVGRRAVDVVFGKFRTLLGIVIAECSHEPRLILPLSFLDLLRVPGIQSLRKVMLVVNVVPAVRILRDPKAAKRVVESEVDRPYPSPADWNSERLDHVNRF